MEEKTKETEPEKRVDASIDEEFDDKELNENGQLD